MDKNLYKGDLIDLQDIDIKINACTYEKENSELVNSLKHSEEEYKQLQDDLVKNENILLPYKDKIKESETLLDKYNLSIENNLINQSSTNIPTELTNFILKKEQIIKNINDLNNAVGTLNKEFDVPLVKNSEINLEILEVKKNLISQSKEVMNFWKNLDEKIKVLKLERSEVSSSIPNEFLERYEVLRKSQKVVVGYINEEQCGICGFIFSSHELSKLENGEEDQCPSCDGILL